LDITDSIISKHPEYKTVWETPQFTKVVKQLFILSLKMKVANPAAVFEFYENGVKFNEDYHIEVDSNHVDYGKIYDCIQPAYVVIHRDGSRDVYTKAIVLTELNDSG
jgi:hypothetical protein